MKDAGHGGIKNKKDSSVVLLLFSNCQHGAVNEMIRWIIIILYFNETAKHGEDGHF